MAATSLDIDAPLTEPKVKASSRCRRRLTRICRPCRHLRGKRRFLLVCAVAVSMLAWLWASPSISELIQGPVQTWPSVFRSGSGVVYRIPSLLWVPWEQEGSLGRLLAFAEKRESSDDWGSITISLRESADAGKTWYEERDLFTADQLGLPGESVTAGNPTIVFDEKTNMVNLLFVVQLGEDREDLIWSRKSRGSRWVFISQSADAGSTWSTPRNITSSVKKPAWTWYATGPGAAIQLSSASPFHGRLVAPCDHVETKEDGDVTLRSHLIYSDDGGATWTIGAIAEVSTNECAVAEVGNGSLLLNSRDWSGAHQRVVHRSLDGGATWDGSEPYFDEALREPGENGCEAAMISHAPGGRSSKDRHLFFSNPDSSRRQNLTLKLSWSNGQTWERARVLYAGPAAYSALAILPPEAGNDESSLAAARVACLFECGTAWFGRLGGNANERIDLAILRIGDLHESP